MNVEQSVIVISGAGGGLGAAIARRFAAQSEPGPARLSSRDARGTGIRTGYGRAELVAVAVRCQQKRYC